MGDGFPGKIGVVSHVLPPSPSGQAMVLYHLFNGLSPNRYCLISRENYEGSIGEDGSSRLKGKYYRISPEMALPAGDRLMIPYLSIPAGAAANIARRARQIARIVRQEGCRLLIGCTGDMYDLPAACLASVWEKIPFIPYLFDDYLYQWTGASRSVSMRLEPRVFRWAKGAIVPNEYLGEEYARRYGARCAVVRNPCRLPELDALAGPPGMLPGDAVNIVYAGAIYHANCDAFRSLLAAIRMLGRTDIRLHVYTAQSAEEIGRMGIAGLAVAHHPHIPNREIPAVLRQASILYLPLGFDTPIPEVIRTSAPGKMGEYLSVGRPILAHAPEDSFVSWYFRENRCGLVAERNEPGLLASSIERLLSDRQLGDEFGVRARLAAERDFDADAVRARFLEALVTLAGEGT